MTSLLQIINIQNQHISFMFRCVVFINITANRTIQGYYNQVNSPKLISLVYDKITAHVTKIFECFLPYMGMAAILVM